MSDQRKRNGSGNYPPADPLDRLWRHVEKSDGCWLWTGATARGGYGQIRVDGRLVYAHRLAYELLVEPIPPGLEIDHLCRQRECVRPEHLQAVTLRENRTRANRLRAKTDPRDSRVTHAA